MPALSDKLVRDCRCPRTLTNYRYCAEVGHATGARDYRLRLVEAEKGKHRMGTTVVACIWDKPWGSKDIAQLAWIPIGGQRCWLPQAEANTDFEPDIAVLDAKLVDSALRAPDHGCDPIQHQAPGLASKRHQGLPALARDGLAHDVAIAREVGIGVRESQKDLLSWGCGVYGLGSTRTERNLHQLPHDTVPFASIPKGSLRWEWES